MTKVPGKWDYVRVVRGRKVPKGTEGRVFWVGEVPTWETRYYDWRNRRYEGRLGIELNDGERVFVPEAYCVVIENPEEAALAADRAAREVACEEPFCEDGMVYIAPDDDRALMAGKAIGEALRVPCPRCVARREDAETEGSAGAYAEFRRMEAA